MRRVGGLSALALVACSRASGVPVDGETAELGGNVAPVRIEIVVAARPPVLADEGVIWPRERRSVVERPLADTRAWLMAADGTVRGLQTDGNGVIELDAGAEGRLVVAAEHAAMPISVRDCDGDGCLTAPVWAACLEVDGDTRRLTVGDDSAVGGAFWLLQTVARGYRVATDAFFEESGGAKQIGLVVAWRRGQTPSCETSCFTVDGATGVLSVLSTDDDTDEFDDHVVLHEVGHFVEWAWLGGTSGGGYHDGAPVPPRLAFSEGFATWFATAVASSSVYIDGNRHGGAWADYTQMPVQPPESLEAEASEEWGTVLLREVLGWDGAAAIGRLSQVRGELDGDAFGALSVLIGRHGSTVDHVADRALSRFLGPVGLAHTIGALESVGDAPPREAAESPITPLRLVMASDAAGRLSGAAVARESVQRVVLSRHRADGSALPGEALVLEAPDTTARFEPAPDEAFVRATFDLLGGVRYFASATWGAEPVLGGGPVEDVTIDGVGRLRCAPLSAAP